MSQAEDEIDPVWTSSRTARQIYTLGSVEKDIARLLSIASSSISLLTLPQTDEPESGLPQGEERSEQFVLEVSEYFERLDAIQGTLKDMLAHIKHARIAPSTISAPPPTFVPPSLGVGIPSSNEQDADKMRTNRGLQEERVERDAWNGILEALQKLKDKQAQEQKGSAASTSDDTTKMDETE